MRYTIIVAGGRGTRMAADVPKQFLPLGGRPILMHTIEAFHRFDPLMKLIVVLPADEQARWAELCRTHHFSVNHTVADGGADRFHSVANGLRLVDADATVVGVHDGVRPLVPTELIQRLFDAAEHGQAAVPVVPMTDSVRQVDGSGSHPVDRSSLRLVQTPQVFPAEMLRQAYRLANDPRFTDDASVVEAAGHSVTLVEGDRRNLKITTPTDLRIAETLL